MYKKFTWHPLGKSVPTLVNIFTKFTKYTQYQVKDTWLQLYYNEYVMYQKV